MYLISHKWLHFPELLLKCWSCIESSGSILEKWQQKEALSWFSWRFLYQVCNLPYEVSPVWFVGVYQLLVRNTTQHIKIFHLKQLCSVFCRNLIFRAQGKCEEFSYYFKLTKSRSKAHCFKAFWENTFFSINVDW